VSASRKRFKDAQGVLTGDDKALLDLQRRLAFKLMPEPASEPDGDSKRKRSPKVEDLVRVFPPEAQGQAGFLLQLKLAHENWPVCREALEAHIARLVAEERQKLGLPD
jgi:HEAT repeat protein